MHAQEQTGNRRVRRKLLSADLNFQRRDWDVKRRREKQKPYLTVQPEQLQ